MKNHLEMPIPTRLPRLMLLVVVFLITMSTLGQFSRFALEHPKLMGFVPAFYLDYESNIPTWWSSFAFAVCAAIAALIAWQGMQSKAYGRFHWAAISVLLLGLSMDEVAMLHEYPIDPMRDAFGFGGALYYPWVIPGVVAVLVVGLSFSRFLLRIPRSAAWGLLAAGVVFVSGAIGVEMISGIVADTQSEASLMYAVVITLEESLEMLGVVLLAHVLMRHLTGHCLPEQTIAHNQPALC